MATFSAIFTKLFTAGHYFLAASELRDLLLKFLGRAAPTAPAAPAQQQTAANPAATAAPSDPVTDPNAPKSNAMGQGDDRGLLYLKTITHRLSDEQRSAWAFILARLSAGENEKLMLALVRAGVKPVKRRDVMPGPAGSPADMRTVYEYTSDDTVDGSAIVRELADDVLAAGLDESARQTRAAQLAAHLRQSSILRNAGDTWSEFVDGVADLFPELRDLATLRRVDESIRLIGWKQTRELLMSPNGRMYRKAIADASDAAALECAQIALRNYIVRAATLVHDNKRQRWPWFTPLRIATITLAVVVVIGLFGIPAISI